MTDAMPPVDAGLFRRVMGRFATGVTVITTEAQGGVRGMTANAFMSGSLAPPLCVIAVARKARLHRALETSGQFGVSMLAQGQEAISRHFAGQGTSEPELLFEHIAGVPVLAHVCAATRAPSCKTFVPRPRTCELSCRRAGAALCFFSSRSASVRFVRPLKGVSCAR